MIDDLDRKVLELTEPKRVEWDSRAAWSRVEAKLDGRPRRSVELLESGNNKGWMLGVAAAVVLAVGGAVRYEVTQRRAEALRVAEAARPVPMNEVVTRRAQRAAIQLVDGTKITLNVDSKLRYAQSYGVSNRVLELEGEAYFEVAHDSIPFVVHTAGSRVRDIGTRFMVSAYPSLNETTVVVSDGAVVLSGASDSVMLSTSMRGVARPSGAIEATSGVDVADQLAWIEGRLVFVGTPLSEVVRRLSRRYDIDVRLADTKLGSVPFSGTFRNENPESVLRLMAASAGARVKRSGAAFVISR